MDRDTVIQQIVEEIESLASGKVKDYEQDIFESKLLDSLNVLNLLVFIEGQFKIKVESFDITLDTFRTVNKITDFVILKLQTV